MAFYRRKDAPSPIEWDDVLRRPPPDLRRPLLVIGALFLAWILLAIVPGLYTDYRWFEEVGYTSVLTTEWTARLAIFFAAALAFFLFYLVNVLTARRLTPRVSDASTRWAQIAAFAGKSTTLLLIAGGAFLALLVGLVAQDEWLLWLRYTNTTPFGVSDPIFQRDISFYVFTLPVYQFLVSWLGGAVILTAIAVSVTYLLGLGRVQWTAAVKSHLSALGVAFLAINAWSYQLDIASLVYSPRGVVFGASYTDVNAQMPAYNILTILALVLAALLLVNIFIRALKAIGIALALWFAAAILLGQMYPSFVQNFEVKPNEFVKEAPFIKYNIALTRQAYALDSIEQSPYPAEETPSLADLQRNADTVSNIRLQDYRPLLQTFDQIQTIRTYYDFADVDVDRYTINGKYRQVMLSARELAPQKLTDKAQTWVNLHLVYTHGYGVAISAVNEFTADGLPTLLVKDIPPIGVIPITRPEIYFGEETRGYVFVKTREKEFDYPKGDENVFATYQGTGGVPIGSLWDRTMFALRLGDANILLTDALTGESRILLNRRIQTRLNRLAPFLALDRDPYPVIAEGKILWVQDAYTTSDRYPYSEPHESGVNYIRNSVKIVIDAYNGTTSFFITDADEPILKTYRAIFPALFKPMEQMPASVREHLRYPEGLFTIQAEMYRTYHMQDPLVFYNKEDLWAVPNESTESQQTRAMEPYYVIMRLPGDAQEEFMLMLPFTPAKRQNMVAWMSAKSDGADYGKRLVYRLPKDKLIYGPEQIHARLNQDPAIAAELTLLNQRGSRVLWGNLLVIPLEKSFLYVQPMYLLAEQSQIPQLKRIVVSTANNVAMEATLGDALARVFGADTRGSVTAPTSPAIGTPAGANVNALIKEANDHYARAQDALKTSDWTTYGTEMKALQQTLERLMQVTGQKQ